MAAPRWGSVGHRHNNGERHAPRRSAKATGCGSGWCCVESCETEEGSHFHQELLRRAQLVVIVVEVQMVRRNQGGLQPACQGTRTGRTFVDEVAGRASLALALGCTVRVCQRGQRLPCWICPTATEVTARPRRHTRWWGPSLAGGRAEKTGFRAHFHFGVFFFTKKKSCGSVGPTTHTWTCLQSFTLSCDSLDSILFFEEMKHERDHKELPQEDLSPLSTSCAEGAKAPVRGSNASPAKTMSAAFWLKSHFAQTLHWFRVR